ncbi:hypothetical protein N7532_003090 [Penicillium argentinense]|uniref:PIPK domain-containing protein n=1 Tax=Penicillium argentinense TaxID=1131581 RepID=A0A9W9FLU3_9EURO|nr:uncharacterized protein N7532_003090 [Penicillium argentinense]KAJ5102561.1 hypothetical protein N7532_003090 [Penicillium argentinense]
MGTKRREKALAKSIQAGLLRDPDQFKKSVWGSILAFFTLHRIKLLRHEMHLFAKLRQEIWQFNEDEYHSSFRTTSGQPPLKMMGDLGYSGSVSNDNQTGLKRSLSVDNVVQTFITTTDGRFVIKSLPRHFEYTFFQSDLLGPYYEFMQTHPDSVLVWITDYILSPYVTLGTLCGCTPAHHIIMENILCGQADDPNSDKWETYDLKPIDYFYPERDLVPEPLVSEDTINKLADVFNDKLHLYRQDSQSFLRAVEADTKFLQDANVVDYSLFLVRIPASSRPPTLGRKSPWREGILSADGKWKYRGVILDFFWAKHKLHAQAMSGAVQTFNVVGRKGPMSVTTTADEYRSNFLKMVREMVEVH